MNSKTYHSSRGFTLVELSIVLAIIGLLVGGVLGARMMMRNQELRKIMADASAYSIAFKQFEQQYNALPGDMVNAAEIWGRADGVAGTGDCDSPNLAKSTGKGTCNGNGNGIVDVWWGDSAYYFEGVRAWQQMAAAGLISGSYTGVGACLLGADSACAGTPSMMTRSSPGVNVPGTPYVGKTYYGAPSFALYGNDVYNPNPSAAYFDPELKLNGGLKGKLVYGIVALLTIGYPQAGALTPDEAFSLDTKSDDGLPGQGAMQTTTPYASGACTTSSDPMVSQYSVSNSSATCPLIFKDAFTTK